ncbi:MAG: ATP-binding cassette domain-containing protein [Lachnospiraceae bacterium]
MMLNIDHLNISYNHTPAVQDLSLAVGAGQIVGIAGESGSGKSTMLRSITGLLGKEGKITSGDIWFENRQLQLLGEKEMEKIRGKDISMIFQQPESSFDPVTTIGKQFCEALGVHEKISKKEALGRGMELLKKLHFPDPERIMDSYAFELSGGMCQGGDRAGDGMQSEAFTGR